MDVLYTNYYNNQSGNNVQNIGEIYHTPRFVQYSRGIGSLFSSLFSHLKPILRTGLNYLKNKSLDISVMILTILYHCVPLLPLYFKVLLLTTL